MRVLTALTLALFAGPAFAAEGASSPTAPVEAAAPKPVKVAVEKKVCKVVDVESGTRMRKRTCKTVTEWQTPQTDSSSSGAHVKSYSSE